MQPEFAKEIIDIIIAAIIYLIAFSLLMRELIGRIRKQRALADIEDDDSPSLPAQETREGEST